MHTPIKAYAAITPCAPLEPFSFDFGEIGPDIPGLIGTLAPKGILHVVRGRARADGDSRLRSHSWPKVSLWFAQGEPDDD
jgi:hypothetical protein